jgi:hypothetical protein
LPERCVNNISFLFKTETPQRLERFGLILSKKVLEKEG